MRLKTIILGGGDLASGVALRLFRSGLQIIITELPEPIMVRRLVSFGEAMYRGEFLVEGVASKRITDAGELDLVLAQQMIPVIAMPVTSLVAQIEEQSPLIIVDARMRKQAPEFDRGLASLVLGLGPGFVAGKNCHAVIETQRGHWLGRVIWQGEPLGDTGIPEKVQIYDSERVLRAPAEGIIESYAQIGDHLQPGQCIAKIGKENVVAPFKGVLRGLVHTGLQVTRGMKIGDVDPRDDPRYCIQVSDKSLAIGGAVLEAILTKEEFRPLLWK